MGTHREQGCYTSRVQSIHCAPHVLFHSMAFETMEKYHRRLRQPQIQVNCALLSKLIVTSDPLQESGNVHQNLFQKQNFTTTKVSCSMDQQ